MSTQIIHLPFDDPPLTKNKVRRMHFRKESSIRREAIEEVREAIREAGVEPREEAVIVLGWLQPNNVKRDGDGADPTKAFCIDSLVLEGVIPDDSWRFVIHSGVTCRPPIKGLPGAMWLELHDPTNYLKERP